MKEVLLSVATGVVAGMAFSLFRLPVPAPSTWAGIAGVMGLFLGYLLGTRVFRG